MNIPKPASNSSNLEQVLSRFQTLSIPSRCDKSLTPTSFASRSSSDFPQSQCALDPPFAMTYSYSTKDSDDVSTVIDTFSPRTLEYDLSPTSSASSDFDSQSSHSSFPRSSYEAFVATRSRVVRLYNLPRLAEAFLSAVFLPQSQLRGPIPAPITMWTLREDTDGPPGTDSVWAVYNTHEEAAAALSLSGPIMSVTTALESDLEPFHKLRRFVPHSPPPTSHASRSSATVSLPQMRVSSSQDLHSSRMVSDRISMEHGEYTLSSNPPNPRTSFRLGDWICSSPKCAAHNFGRNLACIGCGCPRSTGGMAQPQQQQTYPQTRTPTSPRFASYPPHSSSLPAPAQHAPLAPQQQPSYTYVQPQQPNHRAQQQQPQPQPQQQQQHTFSQPPKSGHPLLTPSGRAFAIGGKVQNISSDPLAPCIMYWPDNEPFPEQGQIRPSGLVGVPQPPILNTGNRGPISHQPGDWVCQKCNYLNWRRRKVCQTCLPYAEGNGDSISAAVQAERIALLTSVLAQTQQNGVPAGPQLPSQAPRSHSMTPPQHRRPFIDVSPPQTHAPVHRSHSHFELGAQYTNNHPIYQTSGHRQPSPLYSTGPDFHRLPVHAPAPLLPSFLQDIVQSPALSPTSSSSADLSFEEYEDMTSMKPTFPRPRTHSGDSATSSPLGNIWRLDGEESKSLSAFALPNHQDLMGGGRRNSREGLQGLQVVNS